MRGFYALLNDSHFEFENGNADLVASLLAVASEDSVALVLGRSLDAVIKVADQKW